MRTPILTLLSLALSLPCRPAAAAVTVAPGWAVRGIPTPGTVQGGVVRRGAILVGQGSFGAGAQSIVRLDGAGATTVATGFNSLGGFDLDAAGTLYVVDNCLECAGAATGDTLFAVPDALSRTAAVTAAGQEVLPAGSIPAAQDVVAVPDAILVSDATGGGAGRVLRVAGTTATTFLTGFDFTAGLALGPGGTLVVGDVDGATFEGELLRFALDGTPLGPLVGGLSGTYAHVVDGEGNVLVSGGFTADFSSSTVVAVAPDGDVTERARGFAFSSEMFYDTARDELLVLDFGATEITAICRERDADGLCDADDPCTGGAAISAARLKIAGLATPPGDDALRLRTEMTLPFPLSPPLDPVATGVRVLIDGAAGTVLDATVPPGAFDEATKTGWKAKGAGTSWTYRSPAGPLGIRRVVVKAVAGTPGLVKVAVVGREDGYAVTPAHLPLRAVVALDAPVAREGQCGEAAISDCALTAARLRCGR